MTDQIKLPDGVTLQQDFMDETGQRRLVFKAEVPNRALLMITFKVLNFSPVGDWISRRVRSALTEYAYQVVPYSPSARRQVSHCRSVVWDEMYLAKIKSEIEATLVHTPDARLEMSCANGYVEMQIVSLRDETDAELAARRFTERAEQDAANTRAAICDLGYQQYKTNRQGGGE